MKRLALITAPLFFIACGDEETAENNNENTNEIVESCTYSYDSEATELTWTGFKLTDRVGVNGTFDEINVTANDESEDMYSVLTGATFSIPVESINSQDPTRDPKLRKNFFGTMTETAMINGTINSINSTTAQVNIVMNGVGVDYSGTVSVDGETITCTMSINMVDFDAQPSVDALNAVCLEKHTGEDGKSKLWSEVDLAVKTTLVKNCK